MRASAPVVGLGLHALAVLVHRARRLALVGLVVPLQGVRLRSTAGVPPPGASHAKNKIVGLPNISYLVLGFWDK